MCLEMKEEGVFNREIHEIREEILTADDADDADVREEREQTELTEKETSDLCFLLSRVKSVLGFRGGGPIRRCSARGPGCAADD